MSLSGNTGKSTKFPYAYVVLAIVSEAIATALIVPDANDVVVRVKTQYAGQSSDHGRDHSVI